MRSAANYSISPKVDKISESSHVREKIKWFMSKLPEGNSDLAISFGGDGEVLNLFRQFPNSKLLGIKIEDGRSLGFFTAATLQECNESTIKSIQQDKFQLIKLNLLECQIGNKKYKILNDAAILRRPNGKSGRFTVNVGCDNFEAVGDGVIISSPAGSSSYNFSTGGAILSWDLFAYGVRFFNITRGLRSVSLIVPGETITTVVTHYPAFIELDGFGLEIEAETKLTLQLSHEFAQLVCFKYQGQLTRLKKLVRTTALD